MDLTREKELLTELQSALNQASARVEAAQAEVDELVPLVEGLRARIRRLEGPSQMVEGVDKAEPVHSPPRVARTAGRRRKAPKTKRKHGMRPLAVVLRDATAAPGRWTTDDLIQIVADSGEFAVPPKRVSFTNRLNELVRD